MIEVPGYYQGPVGCGDAGCGEDPRVTFIRGVKTLARAWALDGIMMTRRVCSRMPNPHPNYACTNPVECPNPSGMRRPKGMPNTFPMEIITRETQPVFSKKELEASLERSAERTLERIAAIRRGQ